MNKKHIFITIKWYENKGKFELIKELLKYKNIECEIEITFGNSIIKVLCDDKDIEFIKKVKKSFLSECSGGIFYHFVDGSKVDITKPLVVYDLTKIYPKVYSCQLLDNVLKESQESIRIITSDNETFGFMKFDPNNISINKPFIVANQYFPFHINAES